MNKREQGSAAFVLGYVFTKFFFSRIYCLYAMANSSRFIFPVTTPMPTTNYKSSWINQQYCELAKISHFTPYTLLNLILKNFIRISLKSLSESVSQACQYAVRFGAFSHLFSPVPTQSHLFIWHLGCQIPVVVLSAFFADFHQPNLSVLTPNLEVNMDILVSDWASQSPWDET